TSIYIDALTDENGIDLWQARRSVIKTHIPGPFLRQFAVAADARVILTVRDARDGVASLMQRFDLPFAEACDMVARSANSLPLLRAAVGHERILILKYEDGFTRRQATLERMARHLGLKLPKAAYKSIAEALSPYAVKTQIAEWKNEGVFDDRPAVQQFDKRTQWHPRHVGDGKSGKWRTILTEEQAIVVGRRCRSLQQEFGYEPAAPIAPGGCIAFGAGQGGAAYLDRGFSHVEFWGVWTCADKADLVFPLADAVAGDLSLAIRYWPGPTLQRETAKVVARIHVNGVAAGTLPANAPGSDPLDIRIDVPDAVVAGTRRLVVQIIVEGLPDAVAIKASACDRIPGIGLTAVTMDYRGETMGKVVDRVGFEPT
ncbi:MAG: sulfotransferase domain-containing protein, partial [bacterium]|nr:sulfotransferase domain-containing protein [bacterium]